LRISREQALVILAAARYAGLPLGAFIAGLLAGVPALTNGASHNDHLTALIASSAELSTLSRNIYRLTALLRQANVEPARQYREMLDTLAGHVRSHLKLAASVLADLRPRGRRAEPLKHPTSRPTRRHRVTSAARGRPPDPVGLMRRWLLFVRRLY
jgi:hypothetical protein